jgi:hypothetical protein
LSERWTRIGELFDAVVNLPPAEREVILAAAAESDAIKREVRSLLTAHDAAGSFLDGPVVAGDTPAFAPGTMLGPYRVVRIVGRGGMGIVYEAEDTRLHRRVALKSLPPEVAADEHQRRRLRQEARAAAALQHPGIATVYALEEIDDHVFISSELLTGATLRHELERGPLSPVEALTIAEAIARALCAAHERGIVHRDLKPENIARTADGSVKILDFGLAQFDRSAADALSRSRLTLPGVMVGTPPYMAPEQLLGRPTDFRVDHFAFGVLLYELCTGTHPFGAHSLPSTIARILADAPDPPTPSIRAELWQVIDRCLQKNPGHRFPTTRDLLAALDASTTKRAPAAPRDPDAPGGHDRRTSRLFWWRFHQFAAAIAYWSMIWPAWHVHRAFGRAGLFFFFATLAAVIVAGNLRLHLWFSSRVYPEDLDAQREDVSRWIRAADVGFAALLIIGGVALPDTHGGWGALFISFGIGAAVAFIFIEPATTRAAFRQWNTRKIAE